MQSFYPVRAFIRFSAKSQLLTDSFDTGESTVAPSHDGGMPVLGEPGLEEGLSVDLSVELSEFDNGQAIALFDEELFQVVATTVLHPCRNPDVYQGHRSLEQARVVEERVSQEIVSTYRLMSQAPATSLIDRLNRLL